MTQPDLFADPQLSPRRENPVAQERRRLNAAARRVLARLQEGAATNVELSTPEIGGLRAIGRVHELRGDGWVIENRRLRSGLWLYTLIGRKSFA